MSLPRGFRNNNPGNIRPGRTKWNGEVGVDTDGGEPGYLIFDTAESGIRAAALNLVAYQKRHGIRTIAGIVRRWAPKADANDEGMYIAALEKHTGIGRDAALELREPETLRKLLLGIFRVELGPAPGRPHWYSNAVMDEGIRRALQ